MESPILIVLISTIATFFLWWIALLWSDDSEIASTLLWIFGLVFVLEIIFLLVRFIKFVWFL